MLTQRGVHVGEDHALGLEVLVHLVVDDLGLVLGTDPGQELALRLGDPEPVEGLLDVLGHVIPGTLGALGRAHEIVNVVVVDLGHHRRAPGRLGTGQEVVERLEAERPHPFRLGLELGDLLHDLAVEALRRLVQIVLGVVEAVALRVVGVDACELLVLRERARLGDSHYSTSSLIVWSSMMTGNVSTDT